MSRNIALFFAALLVVLGQVTAQYQLIDNYQGQKFFDGFEFFNEADPTRGNVKYVDASTANSTSLAGFFNDKVYLTVDRRSGPSAVRPSTRVSSKKTYNHGLFIADFAHMPVGCAVWPAYWTVGAGWPNHGEIDVLEGVNSDTHNHVTMHTGPGCILSKDGLGAAPDTTTKETDCAKDDSHIGCGQRMADPKAYGKGFNANGGGVFAFEWTSTAIKTWFFPRGSAQAEALRDVNKTPDVASFGTPTTIHGGSGCNIDQHFVDHQIIFDTTLCGDWAGSDVVWQKDATCAPKAATCKEYLAAAGKDAFKHAYWLINYVRVYQQNGGGKAAKRGMQEMAFTA